MEAESNGLGPFNCDGENGAPEGGDGNEVMPGMYGRGQDATRIRRETVRAAEFKALAQVTGAEPP